MKTPTLLGVPFDGASSFMRGAADAPARIREELRSPAGNAWSEGFVDVAAAGVMRDAGDIDFSNVEWRAAIETAVGRVCDDDGLPISLGGDHSISYPILRALRPRHRRLTILHLDAHPDLYDTFDGDRYSHACPFARIMEERLADRLVQVGIRAMTGHQREQAQRFGVEVIDMHAWYGGRRPSVEGPLYLSLDLDGLDPAFAPGVSHPEPGGLSTRDVLAMIHDIAGPLIGADIVECNPARDPMRLTARVAAKFVKEVVARMLDA